MKFVLSLILCICFAQGAQLGGVEYKEKVQYKNKELVLNGLGIREATWLNIDVYVAALYLEKKATDGSSILQSPETKKLAMQFVRDVKKKKIISAYEDSFEKILGDNYKSNQAVNDFLTKMIDMKVGSTMELGFDGESVELFFNKKLVSTIKDKTFASSLLTIWLGDSPPNKGLKNGLLGKN